jgi:hypothetical protein
LTHNGKITPGIPVDLFFSNLRLDSMKKHTTPGTTKTSDVWFLIAVLAMNVVDVSSSLKNKKRTHQSKEDL